MVRGGLSGLSLKFLLMVSMPLSMSLSSWLSSPRSWLLSSPWLSHEDPPLPASEDDPPRGLLGKYLSPALLAGAVSQDLLVMFTVHCLLLLLVIFNALTTHVCPCLVSIGTNKHSPVINTVSEPDSGPNWATEQSLRPLKGDLPWCEV